jgi:hypothetical protein
MSTRTLRLFVRAEPEPGTETGRERVLAAADRLRRSGDVDEVRVDVWGKEIRLDGPLVGTDYHRTVLSHVRDVESWAATREAPTVVPFAHHRVRSVLAGESYDVVSLPSVCLSVYDDDTLSAVYPCVADGCAHSVADGLADLAGRRSSSDPTEAVTDGAAT